MGSVVTVMNMKGGVGKTTVAMHLGSILARYVICGRARKVLLIDYDPQFNLSQSLLPVKTYYKLEKERKTCLAILQDNEVDLNPYRLQVPGNNEPPDPSLLVHVIQQWKEAQLALIPSTLDLMFVALGQSEKRTTPFEERFEKFITKCKTTYDLVLMDCHPAGSILTKTALQNSDHVIIPVMPQRYAERGIGLMLSFIEAKKVGGKRPIPHILFNAVPRSGLCADERRIRSNTDLAAFCLIASMKRYKIFSEPLEGSGFCWTSGKPYSTEALRNLLAIANEFVERTGIGK